MTVCRLIGIRVLTEQLFSVSRETSVLGNMQTAGHCSCLLFIKAARTTDAQSQSSRTSRQGDDSTRTVPCGKCIVLNAFASMLAGKLLLAHLFTPSQVNTHIVTLQLSDNWIAEQGLCNYHSHTFHVQHTHPCENTISSSNTLLWLRLTTGAAALSSALKSNTTIKVLDISNNRLGYEGNRSLCSFLVHNSHIHNLNLSNNMLDDRAAGHIAKWIQQHTRPPTLQVLNLSKNKLGEAAGLVIVCTLRGERGERVVCMCMWKYQSKGQKEKTR